MLLRGVIHTRRILRLRIVWNVVRTVPYEIEEFGTYSRRRALARRLSVFQC